MCKQVDLKIVVCKPVNERAMKALGFIYIRAKVKAMFSLIFVAAAVALI